MELARELCFAWPMLLMLSSPAFSSFSFSGSLLLLELSLTKSSLLVGIDTRLLEFELFACPDEVKSFRDVMFFSAGADGFRAGLRSSGRWGSALTLSDYSDFPDSLEAIDFDVETLKGWLD